MEINPMKILYPLCVCALLLNFEVAGGGNDFVSLAQKWAPKIYLHSKEEFWPGDVESFLKELTPEGSGCNAVKGVPTGSQSEKCFLTTKGKPYDLLKDKNSFLYGTKPTSTKPVPAYAYVRTCGSSTNVIIAYWIFFPFNKGKDMCDVIEKTPIVRDLRNCKGNNSMVGNHVGDWEHLAVELKGGEPVSLFLSVHDGGVYYKFDKKSNTFQMSEELKHGILKVPNPPKTINLADGHPILYSAEGSHAVWSQAGTFSYSRVELKDLTDVTDQGTEWDTWKALKVFYSKDTTPAWWYYEGRWGNKGFDCHLSYCIFSAGPKGLSIRPDDYDC